MSSIVDKKYINLVSGGLDRFRWKSDRLANCRCPVCSDSQKRANKARGYFVKSDDSFYYTCHNCGYTGSIGRFLELLFPSVSKDYVVETFRETKTPFSPKAPKAKVSVEESLKAIQSEKKTTENPFRYLSKLNSLPPEHRALMYMKKRLIPRYYLNQMYFTETFFKFAAKWKTDFNHCLNNDHQRIIIPFYDEAGEAIGFSARSFEGQEPKYIMMRTDEKDDKLVYGLDRVDKRKQIVVVEGPIDSMFVINSVAACNAALHRIDIGDILVYDNQPRNKDVLFNIKRGIDTGKKVVIWPNWFNYKDINEAVVEGGMGIDEIQKIIYNNCYDGLMAKLKFQQWRKI